MARSAPLVRTSATLWRTGPYGQVLLAPGDEQPQSLDDRAALVWAALAEPVTADELAEDLATVFAANPDAVAADLAPLLAGWVAGGAVVEA